MPSRPVTRRQALGTLSALALPWDQLLAQTTAPTTSPSSAPAVSSPRPTPTPPPDPATFKPDLDNLHPVFDSIARQRSDRLSFLDPQWSSLDAWKTTARAEFHRCLSYNPKPQSPLRAELLRREDRDGFTLEVLRLHASPDYSIPLRVLVPKNPKSKTARLPAVVALHCHGGRYSWGIQKLVSSPDDSAELIAKRTGAYGRPWAEALARRGYLVAVIDAFYFGERRLRVEDLEPSRVLPEAKDACAAARRATPHTPEWYAAIHRACNLYEHLTARNFINAGATWPGFHVWDDLRTVDYLLTRPDVDPARLGCGGLSIGGLRSAHLIAADPRIKAAFITGWMTQFAAQHRNHLRNHTWMIFVPGLYASLDFPDLAALHAPGALLVQQCKQDQLYPLAAMAGSVEHLKKAYAKAGLPDRFRGTFYDVPHTFQPHMQEEAFDWFDRWL